jgi:hypothetical protein
MVKNPGQAGPRNEEGYGETPEPSHCLPASDARNEPDYAATLKPVAEIQVRAAGADVKQ